MIRHTAWRNKGRHRGWIVPEHRHAASGWCCLELKPFYDTADQFPGVPTAALMKGLLSDENTTLEPQTSRPLRYADALGSPILAGLYAEIRENTAQIAALRLRVVPELHQSCISNTTLQPQISQNQKLTDGPGPPSLLAFDQGQCQPNLEMFPKGLENQTSKQVDHDTDEKAKGKNPGRNDSTEVVAEWATYGKWAPVTDQNFAVFESRQANLASTGVGIGPTTPNSYRDFCRKARINPASLPNEDIEGFRQSMYLWHHDYQHKGDGPREIATFITKAMAYCENFSGARWPACFLKCRTAIQQGKHPLTRRSADGQEAHYAA
jgi:hypothetical protein